MGNAISKLLRRTLLKLGSGGPQGDKDLLERYVAQRDEAAFAEIVRQHGPMVRRVCQRGLRQAGAGLGAGYGGCFQGDVRGVGPEGTDRQQPGRVAALRRAADSAGSTNEPKPA